MALSGGNSTPGLVLLFLPLSRIPINNRRRRGGGNVEGSQFYRCLPRGGGKGGNGLCSCFHAFHGPGISTAWLVFAVACFSGTPHALRKQIGHGNGAAMQSMENDETVSHPSHSRLEDADEARVFHIPTTTATRLDKKDKQLPLRHLHVGQFSLIPNVVVRQNQLSPCASTLRAVIFHVEAAGLEEAIWKND